jgi:hypothetical protein
MADATQTSFPVVPAIGNYGDIADGFDTQSESLGAGVTIPFGRAVVSHSVEGQCDLPASSSGTPRYGWPTRRPGVLGA